MSLRTPSTDLNRQNLLNLQNLQAQMAQNTLRLSSGNQITSPGDDPTGTATILDLQNSIQANTQFLQQATAANSFLQSTSDALASIVDEANSLQVLAVQGLGANSAAGMAAMAPQVDAIRTNILAAANTQAQGKYVFAGTQTSTVPFSDAAGTVSYSGDSGSINLGVTATSTVTTNVPGNAVFFGAGGQGSNTDLFKAITDLRDGLSSNDSVKVQTAATNLSNIMNNLYQQQGTVGGRQAGLTDLQSTISGINLRLQSAQSGIQSADVAQTYSDLTNEQVTQQAILSTIAKSNTNNLFNYLT